MSFATVGTSVLSVPAALDIDAERAATPGCATVSHLNNAGASLPHTATLETVMSHLRREADFGGYEAASEATDRLSAVRASAAVLLGADRSEVAITGSDTEGWTKALWGFFLGGGLRSGARILVDRIAYDSHYMGLLQVARVTGATIEAVPGTSDGTLDLDALATALARGDVAMASLTHVGTHRGLVNPIAEAAHLCRDAGVATFVDACQSIGQLPVDVRVIGCDVLTGTGRKWLRGPRGTGLIYLRSGFADRIDPIGLDGRSAVWTADDRYELCEGAQRFVPFEVPVAMHLGLGTAIDHTLELGVDAIAARVGNLAEHLRALAVAVDGVTVHDGGAIRCGIVTFTVEGHHPAQVAAAAAVAGINVSVTEQPAARLDLGGSRPSAVVRASPHYYNTEDELLGLVDVLEELTR